jgi:hypothetical protein
VDTFQFRAVDTNGNSTSVVATIILNVLPVNDRPSFSLSTNCVTVLEDAAAVSFPNFATNLYAGAYNETNQTFSFITEVTNTSFFAGKPSINSVGTLTVRPRRNVTGITTVTNRMKDSGGTLRGGVNLSWPETFEVRILPHPIKPHRGTFNGLFRGTNVNVPVTHPDSGFFTLRMATYGAYSGKLMCDGGQFRFAGKFDLSGHTLVVVPRNSSTLYLDLQLDLANGTDQVTGTVTNAEQSVHATLLGNRVVFNSTNFAEQAGLYTVVIPGGADPSVAPGGDSYGTLKVLPNGTVVVAGRLADGTSFSQSVGISKDGAWPFYFPLLSGQGSVFSWLTFTNFNLAGTSLAGDVSWIKPPTLSKYYPDGFTNVTAAVGSTYTPPYPGVRVLNTTNNQVILSGGNVAGLATTITSVLTETNTVQVSGGDVLKLTTPASGYMSGTCPHPTLDVNKTVWAVALQQQRMARGYFLGTNQSGAFRLLPTD